MSRPSEQTIKKLFALSGNLCAFPGCSSPIVEAAGAITGEICHIHAQRKGGPRMAMALYREHIGEALPFEGEVFVTWSLNLGFRPEITEGILNSLPGLGRLQQGKKTSQGQFEYRFKTDRKTIAIAQSSFHTGLNILSIASSIPGRFSLQLVRGGRVQPGGLLSLMPSLDGSN